LFVGADVQVDHICPLIDPTVGFLSWDSVINNMFCEADNLQVLCKGCHSLKTSAEKQLAKERKANAK
jgi:5-methylcytosine-specific restriction endonuclease McrA